jgi:hypothetical protein
MYLKYFNKTLNIDKGITLCMEIISANLLKKTKNKNNNNNKNHKNIQKQHQK